MIVDNPLAIIHKKVKTKLTLEKAKVLVGDNKCIIDITPLGIKHENLFDEMYFGNITYYEVIDNQLIGSVAGQISPAGGYVGSIVINYEYQDKMYQANSIEFQPCK